MFKKVLSLAAVALMSVGSMNAQIEEGTYYIQNVESGLYLSGTNNWGTRACASNEGVLFTVTLNNGAYKITHTGVSVADKNLGANLYTDNAGIDWTIAPVSGEEGVYTIYGAANGDVGGTGYVTQSEEAGLFTGYTLVTTNPETLPNTAKWYFLTEEEAKAKLANATMENPIDATFLIKNPGFNRNISVNDWTRTNVSNPAGNNDNFIVETYVNTFTLSQTLSVPNGIYKVRAQGAVTYHDNRAVKEYDGNGAPVVFANDATTDFVVMETGDQLTSMSQLSNSFIAQKYWTEWTESVIVTDGELTIGAKSTRSDIWACYDHFELMYYGPLADFSAYESALAAAVAEGEGLEANQMNVDVSIALGDAISLYTDASYETEQEWIDAIDAMKAANDAAKASIAIYQATKDALDAYGAKVAAFDADAQALYDVAAIEAAYNEGSMVEDQTAAVKAAYLVALKAAQPEVDITELASTVWVGQGPNPVAAWACPDAPGSPERFEYNMYVGDVMTQTITGLQNGTYKVTMIGGASTTGERDSFEVLTGQNRAYFFANDALQSLEVYSRTTIAAGTIETAELTCGVTNGELKFGIQNLTKGANWFVVNLVSIEYLSTDLPPVNVELAVGDAQYATFIAPFDAELPAGVQAYTIDSQNKGILTMTEVSSITANQPVLLYAENPVTTTLSGVSQAEGMNYTEGLLTGVYGDLQITSGYVLQQQDKVGFFQVTVNNPMTVPANKAYIAGSAINAEVKALLLPGEATGIDAIAAMTAGQVDGIYTVGGAKVNSLQKGLNIVKANGKTMKVLVK